jgi:predicted enzyme related to lactoylglutathione lyase
MTEMTAYTPGTFCWIDLSTSDGAAAKKFYTELFGWTAVDMPVGPDMTYTMLQIDGKDVAALYQQGENEQGIPPHWNSYVSVTSADEIAARAKALGGTVLAEPFDVMEEGRMAIIQDPTGAVVGVWQPKRYIGAKLIGQTGALCWNEVATRDTQKAGEFYTQLFGWTSKTEDMGGTLYTVFFKGDQMSAGMLQITAEWGDVPPHWMLYLAVDDCDASVERAKSLGGQVLVPPRDVPGTGRFAVLQDPQGAAFSIIKLSS